MAFPSGGLASTPTVLTAWTGTLLRALEARGLDGHSLAVEAGIPAEALADPDRRVPLAASTRLWRAAVDATGDPALGIEVSRHVRPTTFHALGQAFIASPTLRAALERTARFSEVTADIAVATAAPIADGYALTITWRAGFDPPAFEAVDAVLASIVRAARFMLDRSAAPVRLQLERPVPAGRTARFTDFFRCPIAYGVSPTVLVLDRDVAEQPLPGGNAELARRSDEVITGYLAGLAHATSTNRARKAVIDLLPDGEPSVNAVARVLDVSVRSLQRRLAEEGTSFRAVSEAVRRDLACAYLRRGDRSVTELTYLLGFSETAAFSRAFKRWTGVAPSRFH